MRDRHLETFEQQRHYLEGLAYRMLGTLAEAQDAVQDTYLKWHKQPFDQVDNAKAWLTTVCTRTCLNLLQKAYKKRESYYGEWLPEPVFSDSMTKSRETDDSLTIAMLRILETLSPTERAVFILHDVFDVDFDEIASILDKTSSNCRKIASRARSHVRRNDARFPVVEEEHSRLLEQFILSAQACDFLALKTMLAEQAQLYSDGGGKVQALPELMLGSDDIARFFSQVFAQYAEEKTKIDVVFQRFNHSQGLLLFENERLTTAITIECHNNQIEKLFAVRNPDKLKRSPNFEGANNGK